MKKLNRSTLFSRVSKFLPALGMSLVLCMSLICLTATAQDVAKDAKANDDTFTLPEITVTSEYREKSLQRTPLSVSAVKADTIEGRSQITLDQIAVQTPNVSLKPGNASFGSSMVAFIYFFFDTDLSGVRRRAAACCFENEPLRLHTEKKTVDS